MSVEAVARALNVIDDRLTPAQRLVLVGMANHDGDGGCWPGIGTLARYAGLSERSVQRAIGALVEHGYVTVIPQAGGSSECRPDRRPNRYLLRFNGVTDRHPAGERGDIRGANGVTPTSPEPSLEPSLLTNTDVFTRCEAEAVDDFEVNNRQPPWAAVGMTCGAWLKAQKEGS